MSQMRTDCNDSAESDTEDVVLTSRKRMRPANREIERPRKIRKEKFLALQELQIGNDTTSCQTCHCEYENGMQGLQEYEENLRPEKLIRSARDAKHYDKETLFAGGMKRITEHRLVRDLIRRNRAELAKIEGEIEIWKRTYSESVKMLKQLSIQENNLTAELKDTLRLRSNRSRKHRSEIMKRTCVAHVVQNNSQESSLRETSSENSRLPTYPAL